MTTIKITPEIKNEIEQSIKEFNVLIEKEMAFSEHLRKKDKIEIYNNKIQELQQAITNGFI